MEVSFSSIFSSTLSVTLLILLLLLFLKQKLVVTRFGLGCMYLFLILILFRGFLPFDFYSIGLTTSIYSECFLPWLRDFFIQERFVIGNYPVTLLKLLLLIWLIGSLIYALCFIKSAYTLKQRIKSSEKVTDKKILQIFQYAFDTVCNKQTSRFQIVRVDDFGSPALSGIYKPVILLPHLNYSEDELYLVFCHELLHYRHKDYIVQFLTNVLGVIYWWNPLITILFSLLTTQVQELWVDYQVSNTGEKNQRINYLHTLTTTLKQNQYPKKQNADKQILLLSDKQEHNFIRQRFDYIKTHSTIKSFTLFGILICLALFLSTYTIVLEPRYNLSTDENGDSVFEDIDGQTYFIRNGDKYDLYMQNTYAGTIDTIPDEFKDCPIYDNKEEVTQYED